MRRRGVVESGLGTQYTQELGDAGSLTARLDAAYRSLVYFNLANTPAGAQSGYTLANARISGTNQPERWTLAVEIANLTNKLYYLTKTPALNADGSLFPVNGTPGVPRTGFVTIERHFH